MHLKDYLRIIKRRLHWIILVFAVVISAHALAIHLERDIYESTSKLLRRFQWYIREYAATRGLTFRAESQIMMSTQEAMILDRPVLEIAAKHLRASQILLHSREDKHAKDMTVEEAIAIIEKENDPILETDKLDLAVADIQRRVRTRIATEESC